MTITPTSVLAPVRYEAGPVNPMPFGLYGVTDWQPTTDSRWLNGVEVRGPNHHGELASGVWAGAWCGDPTPGQLKDGERGPVLDSFAAMTVWAYDECDLTEPSRREVESRAAQVLRLTEQRSVEREFSERLKFDAADLPTELTATAPTLKEAVAALEGLLAGSTDTPAYLHVGAQWPALEEGLFKRQGTRWVSPLGYTWVIGGGYVAGLENQIVATSTLFGWRDEPTTRATVDALNNVYAAVAERSVTIGYEAVLAAVTIG